MRTYCSPVLSARGLTKSFARGLARSANRTRAIDDVSLDVGPGEIVGLVGIEGAGKSTLLQCIAGLLRRDAGNVELLGRPFDGGGCSPLVAYVPAVPVFYPFLTVRDVLEFKASRLPGVTRAPRVVEQVIEGLGLVGEARCRISVLPRDLIVRLSIAEALVGEPEILLIDTSVNDLSRCNRDVTLRAVRDFVPACAVILAARDAAAVAPAATRLLFMENGSIAAAYDWDAPRDVVAGVPAQRPSLLVAEGVH